MSSEADEASIASRQERAAGRILDDEGLRGDLADDEFQPLLAWALAESDRAAESTAGVTDAEADAVIDERLQAIRDVLRAAAAAIVAHAEGDASRRSAELAFIGTRWPHGADLDALARRLDAEADLTGQEIATALVAALTANLDDHVAGGEEEQTP